MNSEKDLITMLEDELETMKKISKQGLNLKVIWLPRKDGPLSGEVKGKTIYIYEENREEALEVLKHEFIDYLVTSAIDPYRQIINNLVIATNRIAYLQKEKIVESLKALLNHNI